MDSRRARSRNAVVMVGIAYLVLAACGGNGHPTDGSSPDQRSAPAPGSILHLKYFDIVDRQGFGQPVPVASLLAPVDWRLEGGVTWTPQWRCMIDMVRADARLVSPDGRVAFQIFPAYETDWEDDPVARRGHAMVLASGGFTCPQQAPFTAEQFITSLLIPGFRKDAAITERTPAPDVARAYVDRYGPLYVNRAGSIMKTRFEADAARVRIRYDDSEEWLFATVGVVTRSAPAPSAILTGNWADQNTYSTTADRIYGFRAPAGELDRYEPLAATMIESIRLNPAWQTAVSQVQINIARIIQKGIADRAAIVRQTQQEIAGMQMQAWENRQASQDRIVTNWSHAMRGTETYVNPSGGPPVELPAHCDTVWTNNLGEYALVMTPGANPNQTLGGTWTQMQKKR